MDFELEKPRLGAPIKPPQHLDRMIEAAESIGREFDFVRVDLYDLPDHPRFGELTFYPGSASIGSGRPAWTCSSAAGGLNASWTV